MSTAKPKTVKKQRIMIVDDEEVFRKLLLSKLKDGYEVEMAVNGVEALEKVKYFKADLFLVDRMMPKMDGVELIKNLRQMPEFLGTPIIMLTARDQVKDKVQGFEVGADDYVTKPFNLMELSMRIESFLKKSKKTKYVSTLLSTLGNDTSEEDIDLLGHDLKAASTIQLNLMPSLFPVHDKFDFSAKMIPAKIVGGDFYDFIPIENDRVVICLGDVSGKGITAALLMIMIRTIIRVLLAEKLSLVDICQKVNSMLIRDVGMGKFVTMFIGILNMETACFESYVNAGHLPPYIIKKDGRVGMLDTTAPFLGAFPDVEITSNSYSFDKGDLLAIYTDGVTELEQSPNVFFGDENFIRLLKTLYDIAPDEMVEKVVEELNTFSSNKSDDVTLVFVKHKDF
ncbi:MAG: Alkaline phosphatase synthesis transcriptional regulatory protein PhoP [bacterium ADurb.Bin243]|nr:MAG: Alkaline phosphatase synthesis transcriptional regulatory protein PhoP [bacterium ADurb.Bin243]